MGTSDPPDYPGSRTAAPGQVRLILVTGFGPFGAVVDNPAARVARGVHGRRTGGETVVGVVIPTSFARGPGATIAVARALRPRFVVGIGVATARSRVEVERRAKAVGDGRTPDVDGATLDRLDGPDVVAATLDPERLAAALGADLSDDAGRYVCNAWFYRVTTALDVPVGFVHVPSGGLDPERLLAALRWILAGSGPARGHRGAYSSVGPPFSSSAR